VNKYLAYVYIMRGCDNYCTYCVVPFTKGREKYRKKEDILKEVKELVKKGYKEITLLGQSIAAYPGFAKLLKTIDDIPGNFKISFLTSHPKDFSDDLIETIKKSKKIKRYIYLPLQSGDNEILRKMNRKYRAKDYLKIIKKLRQEIPEIEISTDIIVGFPGETEKRFRNTVNLVKKAGFDNAYIACYSPRPGTAALRFKDNIPQKEKEKRAEVLRRLLRK
jgi:tRNA-2-methylthio-N6-dimethylallyladenosine synthase